MKILLHCKPDLDTRMCVGSSFKWDVSAFYTIDSPKARNSDRILTSLMKMSDTDLTNECKSKGLASYGVRQEKIERLLKYHGAINLTMG